MLNSQHSADSDSWLQQISLERIEAEERRRATERSLRDGVDKVRKRCKTLVGFVREAWPILEPGTPYTHGRVIEVMAAHLEAITFGTFMKLGLNNRLIENVPPGTMKSMLVSVLWQAWEWGPCNMGHLRYLSTSFSDENVVRDCRKTRDLVESDWYQQLWPHIVLTRRAEDDFENTQKGGRKGRAFASLTGGRGDRLIIDDPLSTEQAESEADLATAIRIFRESVPSRINNPVKSAIVMIMQRLHQQDPTGVAESLKLGYTKVMLPMEFEADRKFVSPLGPKFSDWRTKEGELLFPERFPREVVDRDKIPLGSYGVAGQFQQRPSARGGIMFKRHQFKIVKAAPAWLRRVRGWDLAATEAKTKTTSLGPAFSAGVKLGRDDNTGLFYIEHVVRDQLEGHAVKQMIKNTAEQDGVTVEIDMPQDPGQAGKTQAKDLVGFLAGFSAYASPETGDKITRARPVAAQVEAGNVYIVEGPWNEDFLAEAELFPAGAFKDQIDALSRAFSRLIRASTGGVASPIVVTTQRTHFGDHPGGG